MDKVHDSQDKNVSERPQDTSPLVFISGLWENISKDGRQYLSGRLGPVRLVLFKNQRRTKTSDPDWLAYVGNRRDDTDPA